MPDNQDRASWTRRFSPPHGDSRTTLCNTNQDYETNTRGEVAQWLEREFIDRKVCGSNPTTAASLPPSRLGQPGSIAALALWWHDEPLAQKLNCKTPYISKEQVATHVLSPSPEDQEAVLVKPLSIDLHGLKSVSVQFMNVGGLVLPLAQPVAQHAGKSSVRVNAVQDIITERLKRLGFVNRQLCKQVVSEPQSRSAVALFRCPTDKLPEGNTRAQILPGSPILDRGSQETEVGFDPQTFALSTTTLHNNALMMSPRLVIKRLQSHCLAQRTSQRSQSTLPELPTYNYIYIILRSAYRPPRVKRDTRTMDTKLPEDNASLMREKR
ncbi:hypothetical protein T265_11401 [Opisthorchis viverrini]|uniref:Uncharacterized protein n=1 Tax=Opisthorchis viverrini TaxID=6198 RepID=A0A074YZ33_OPIVI|nr:hypothetical protein T265_11401 [Opisthorchis viverrini]KER19933.1 hypothetical protein T265_11401 [Opisthorchis viverrini]